MSTGLRGSLASKLVLLTGSILVCTAVIVGGLSFALATRSAEQAALSSLSALATSKRNTLAETLDDYRERLEHDFLISGLRPAIVGVVDGTGDPDALRASVVRECLSPHHFRRVDIVDTAGVIRISSTPAREGLLLSEDVAFSRGLTGVSVVEMVLDDHEYLMRVAGPVLRDGNATVAVVIVAVSADEILRIAGDYTGLGDTGETVLGRRSGDSIEFLAPMRFAPDIRRIPLIPADGETARPMIHATSGQSGLSRARDYRDARVVAAYRPVPGATWGLVVKQDQDEVFAGVRRLGWALSLTLAGLLVIGFFLIVPFVRRVTRPIRELARATDQVADGHLEARVPEEGRDEVARLAVSFNRMVRRVADSRDRLTSTNVDLERSARELTEVHRELELYTYAVTHDLRAPLVSIRGMVELLIEELGPDLSGDARTYLEHIDVSSRRASGLMSDLVTLYGAGRMDAEPGPVDTGRVIQRVVAELRAASPDRDVTIVLAPDLPVIQGSAARLSQVIANLVENAIKFSAEQPGVRVEIGHTLRTPPGGEARHVFHVRDNGPGIPAPDRDRVFDLFHRRARAGIPGTGIGLTLVRRIVQCLGGEVWLESDGGAGTTVFFSLPAEEPEGT